MYKFHPCHQKPWLNVGASLGAINLSAASDLLHANSAILAILGPDPLSSLCFANQFLMRTQAGLGIVGPASKEEVKT